MERLRRTGLCVLVVATLASTAGCGNEVRLSDPAGTEDSDCKKPRHFKASEANPKHRGAAPR
jgi:hypothetical protein